MPSYGSRSTPLASLTTMEWRERDGIRWLEADLPGAVAAFTSRVGGISTGDYAELNVGMLTADSFKAVRENRRRVTAGLGRDPDGVLFGYQVHEAEVVERDEAPSPNPWLEISGPPRTGDGQATANPALTPLVQVADCLPVAIRGERGVAMLHCGWRGLAAGIIAEGARRIGATAAAIGPGIGPCHFEVGPEVTERFGRLGPGIAEGRMLDLPEIARRLLAEVGVEEIESAGLCTYCEQELFFSHRRDSGRTGRQVGMTWITEANGDG